MHNKPVKVHIQIKDCIKSQVIKNKCAPKKIKIQDIPLIIQGNIAIPPSSNKKQVYWINTPVSFQPRRAELSKTQCWFEEAFIPGEKPLSIGVPNILDVQFSIRNRSRLIDLASRLRMAFGSVQTNTKIHEYGISARNAFGSCHDLQKI